VRVVVLSRPATDYARTVEMFVTDFSRQTGKQLEVLDPDSPEGDSLSRTYDIVECPAIIALSDEGHMQNMWTGEMLPTISEVSYYVQ
jgi:hypothetical protein